MVLPYLLHSPVVNVATHDAPRRPVMGDSGMHYQPMRHDTEVPVAALSRCARF
jgi:hypothetical protein